ncbi:hypothetical protein L3H35_10920, partial [Corynebacterium sp. MC-21]|uniref:hypothetical protein n=1 Tax=Corynebacterium parakroppenstedtii TaxID=2828363 RepID=UPI001EF0C5E5
TPRELRTEKPWRDDGGPEFDSRRLHQYCFPWSLLARGFLVFAQFMWVVVHYTYVDSRPR